MCSTTSSKCLCALNAKTDTDTTRRLFAHKKKTKFSSIAVAVFVFFIYVVDISCAKVVNLNEQTPPSLLNEDSVKIHAYYDKDFPHIYLNISWRYPIKGIPFDINITKLNTEKCPGVINYPTYKTNYTNIVTHKNASINHKCTYKIEIFPIIDGDLQPLIVNYTVPDTTDVSNVKAYAFNDEERDDNKGKVKLNITWDNPTDDVIPMSHSIKIYNQNCSEVARYIEVHDIKSTENTKIIESDNFAKIIPGCMYKIEVIAEPSNDLEPPSINYTLAECIGKICSCRYNEPIPTPKIIHIKQITENTVRINWIINTNSSKMMAVHNLTTIFFSLSTSNYIHFGGYTMKENISNSIVNKKQQTDFDVPDIIPGGLYEIKAMIENQDYCVSEFDYKSIQAKHIQETPWVYTIAIPIMFIIMCVSFIWVMWKKKCGWFLRKIVCLNHSNQPHIRRIYQSANMGSDSHHRNRPLLEVPMQFNNLYIEKEILDELERGKVDKFEISPTRLQIGNKIGGGAFGQVFEAKAMAIAGNPGYTTVAVKTIKKTSNPEDLEKFLQEISMLKKIGRHPNIVTLLGCCTLKEPYCMIMEYVPCGDLLHYLRALRLQYEQKGKAFLFTMSKNFDTSPSIDRQKLSECSYISQPETIPLNRLPSLTETECTELGSDIIEIPHSAGSANQPITPRTPAVLECVLDPEELQSFAIQIARGMEHLERKQIVHRDLAARNVLIDRTKSLKISDFGLSRSGIYVNSKQEKVPLRWLSVEAIRDNTYTSKSDVWAYGIVLWEIGTLGGFPYPTVTNHEILDFLMKGKRLEKPENCTDELYELMQMCWTHSEDQRPSFEELVEHLEAIANKRRVYIDFSQLNPSYVFPPTEQQSATQIKTEDNVKMIEIVVTNKSDN